MREMKKGNRRRVHALYVMSGTRACGLRLMQPGRSGAPFTHPTAKKARQ
ncbi:hypothetical protein RSPO_c03172 [Ralstonia solanacearum Po82]|uniref:Uncharacterized protein n=1 Tax=Ralstonia solanacearum (strain Po82) TaxID=1031711 RepID=F6G5N6_RALS8|nr:hypothetical protein RSPO_c03172 [Ralstonia solanacearum Po82]